MSLNSILDRHDGCVVFQTTATFFLDRRNFGALGQQNELQLREDDELTNASLKLGSRFTWRKKRRVNLIINAMMSANCAAKSSDQRVSGLPSILSCFPAGLPFPNTDSIVASFCSPTL